jgi:hypothetical protein
VLWQPLIHFKGHGDLCDDCLFALLFVLQDSSTAAHEVFSCFFVVVHMHAAAAAAAAAAGISHYCN